MHQIPLRRDASKGGAILRALHHLIAIAPVFLLVVGAKSVVPTTGANADAAPSASVNVLQLQLQADAKALPELKMHDMTFALD